MRGHGDMPQPMEFLQVSNWLGKRCQGMVANLPYLTMAYFLLPF